jgi:hypothetical protein
LAGGELSDEDRLAFMTEISSFNWSPRILRKKIYPKKYREERLTVINFLSVIWDSFWCRF